MRYRKKPLVVEAEQWFPGNMLGIVTEYVYLGGDAKIPRVAYGHITTIHGQKTRVSPGDWVITEPGDGTRHYPCKPEIFEATYEPVHDDGE